VLNDPVHEKLETSLEGKMDLPEMREALDDRLRHDHYPAGLLLRAVVSSLDLKWDAAEEDLARLERRLNGRLDSIAVDHGRLGAFVSAFGSRSRLLDATADLQVHLGGKSAAMSTSEQINGEELPEEERKELLRGTSSAARAAFTGRARTRRSGTSTRRSSSASRPRGCARTTSWASLRTARRSRLLKKIRMKADEFERWSRRTARRSARFVLDDGGPRRRGHRPGGGGGGVPDIARFEKRSKFSTWLYGIALNLCRKHLRDKSRHATPAGPGVPRGPGRRGPAACSRA
jgi:hypothetical protein